MRQKSVAEAEQCGLNTRGQLIACGDTLFLANIAPAFERAVRRQPPGETEAARMHEKPKRREVGEGVAFEDAPEIGLDVGRTREARIVAYEPQPRAISTQTPERAFAGIEPVLK